MRPPLGRATWTCATVWYETGKPSMSAADCAQKTQSSCCAASARIRWRLRSHGSSACHSDARAKTPGAGSTISGRFFAARRLSAR